MAFTRLNYDDCSYKQQLDQSINPMVYQLSKQANTHPQRCLSARNSNYSQYELCNIVDTESKLKLLNIRQSDCSKVKNKVWDHYPGGQNKLDICCSYDAHNEWSRFTHPLQNYKELSTNNLTFVNLGVEPIKRHYNFIPRNTHLEVIDNHKYRNNNYGQNMRYLAKCNGGNQSFNVSA